MDKDIYKIYEKIFMEKPVPIILINIKIKQYILAQLLNNNYIINIKHLMPQHNLDKNTRNIDESGIIRKNIIQILKERLNIIQSNHKEINEEEYKLEDSNIEEIEKDVYKLQSHHTIKDINYAMFRSYGNCKFRYDFEDNQIKNKIPDANLNTIQRFRIKVNSRLTEYSKKVVLNFRCAKCGTEFNRSLNDIESTNYKTECNAISPDSGRRCGKPLSTPTQLSKTMTIYSYDGNYINERGESVSIICDCFDILENYEYDCVGLVLEENEQSYIFILDYNPIPKKTFPYNDELYIKKYDKLLSSWAIRDPKETHDLVEDLIKFLDDVIENFTGTKVLGFNDIKFAVVMQKLTQIFNYPINNHIAVIGDNGVGKTFTFEYYLTLLYGGMFKETEGGSISIPSLRGSSKSNRDIKHGNKNSLGLLSTYNNILIDEISQSKDSLIDDLKPLLLKSTYSNDKADGDKIERVRLAHVNITENINSEFLSMFQGEVAKEYDRLIENKVVDNDSLPERFDYKWDIFQPLWTYSNPALKRAVYKLRLKYDKKKLHYIDGHQLSTHERWPFYFVINSGDDYSIIEDRAEITAGQVLGEEIEQKKHINQLQYKLATHNIDEFFLMFTKFAGCKDDEAKIAVQLKNTLKQFHVKVTDRMIRTCSYILKFSRIINKRLQYNKTDFDHVKRYLWIFNRIIYIDELYNFDYKEPVETEERIDLSETSDFGLPDDDF